MKLSRQARTVRDHLAAEKHITSWQAEGVYRIRRLASRIDELVADGFEVLKEEQQDATGQRYIRYAFSERQRVADVPLHPKRIREPRVSFALIRNVMDEMEFEQEDIKELIATLKEKA
ncbi:helix-turn-helix domain-containing protein [Dyella silvatica]|uniref:helix-turn-helix domain-containing protein n=1 Tax=Dyella silvatica TaxID=2992128 RepID=UPI00225278AF|nr:helix-turn-helix domain-containing protein [Dyella silvatica]